MLEPEDTNENAPEAAESAPVSEGAAEAPAAKAPAKKAAKKTTTKKAAAKKSTKKAAAAEGSADEPAAPGGAEDAPKAKKKAAAKPKKAPAPAADEGSEEPTADAAGSGAPAVLFQAPEKPAKKAPARKRTTKKVADADPSSEAATPDEQSGVDGEAAPEDASDEAAGKSEKPAAKKASKKGTKKSAQKSDQKAQDDSGAGDSGQADGATESAPEGSESPEGSEGESGSDESGEGPARRRRRRGGRRRRGRGNGDSGGDSGGNADANDSDGDSDDESGDDSDGSGEGSSRRRRSRQRKPRNPEDEIASVSGSTRLEAKKQRRREGREAGRRRAPIVSEAEFLARRESVERVMVIRQREDYTQIGVLEDKVLVEHYVARKSQTSLIGNVYLGRVQNVLPSMEAAFIDIGKGRNAVIYAGEVNWSALGHKDGQPRKIESVLSPGQTILVQVTKDPVGHKGARLSGQVSLPGRFLVYVPDGNTSGISRKLPDTERNRLKTLLKQIVPDTAGVIVRTAAEGASEEELTRDVQRLTARWQDIEGKIKSGKGPQLLYGEPDLTLKVVRDLFTEDFSRLVVQGDDAWDLVHDYVEHVAPDLEDRLERYDGEESGKDIFAAFRVDEQIAKGLDRKVWLPSGGSLIIDRTEAMTVVDVNTGKFTGSGGNLEETVTKNNLEAAEEMVRQLRLRDIGGIIVIDFIDMVLESNRDLVLRRLVECLGRDRTRHQVAEVTSLGLVQMTRKRIGTGLVEAFSEDCSACKGRGVVIHDHPMETDSGVADDEPRGRRGRGGRGRGGNSGGGNGGNSGGNKPAQPPKPPSPADLAGTRPKPVEDEPAKADETAGDGAADAPAETPAESSPAADEPAEAKPAAKKAPARKAPAKKASAESEPEAETPAEAEAAAETAPEAPPAPTVVTTTRRRRTATRPAGPPAAAATDQPAQPEPAQPESAEPAPAEQPAVETDSAEEEQAVLHVPVKRKGTRKR